MTYDPVCRMEIKDISKADKTDYKGKTYDFCTPLCKVEFDNNPEKYIKKDGNPK